MLSLNPEDRPTCEKVLVDYRNTIFPDYFYTFLQDYVNDMHQADAGGAAGAQDPTVKFASKADEIVEAIADDWSGIIRAVIQEHQLSVGNNDAEPYAEPKVVDHSEFVKSKDNSWAHIITVKAGPAILFLNILTSNMRNCLRASSRIKALEPLLPIADLIPDEEVIDRIIPYVVALLKDEMPQVRAAALETLVQLASLQSPVSNVILTLFSARQSRSDNSGQRWSRIGIHSPKPAPPSRRRRRSRPIDIRSTVAGAFGNRNACDGNGTEHELVREYHTFTL